jgi:15-cis-phytoene desaturase
VERLVVEGGQVAGVECKGEVFTAKHVVVATSLGPAQRIIRESIGEHEAFEGMMRLKSMPVVTFQVDLEWPAVAYDRAVFGTGTIWACFAEQSRTTFPGSSVRLSIILSPSERFVEMPAEEILKLVIEDGRRLGVGIEHKIKGYRKVLIPDDFYSLEPGNDCLRPPQKTPVPGLTLAGDYTRQEYLGTMGGRWSPARGRPI